ncbi:hypothetical protein MVEN_01518600 [Mycena venus]|uniref:Uncharacterized protein n=1 Tax=Mycena venus TaxID=2733690 RepID=A0A8H6XWG2_9AGAR|nr:hypothetical protein MVEN_01518600 [Mycena venus]
MSNDPVMRLSLSDSATLEYVLSDIPFFCVGLTALAVFAFFIVMRRINLPAIYLYTSSLFAFVAAILDLSQVLLRGETNTDKGLALNTVTGLIDTREVGLALSFGFRYLYLWEFVAQRPRYEPRPRTQVDPLFSEKYYHSASWERWGALGFVLKYALLGSVISIPILQIIWRIAEGTGFSTVYIAESTVQIAVSVLFIAKLMLNLFLSTVAPWWRPFIPYLVPIMALMISTGIGTGNLLLFKFSETTLGRFLQAVETYALILNVLIFTFYNVPRYATPTTVISDRRKRSSFFTGGINEKMDAPPFQVSEPEVVEPVMRIGRAVTTPSSRESVVSRISSWMNVRRPPPRPNSGEQKLWNSGDAELGISTETRATIPQAAPISPISPRVEADEKPRSFEERQRPPLSVNTKESQILVPPTPNTLEVTTPSTANRPFTGVSFASYYGMATSSRLTMPSVVPGDDTRDTDSPFPIPLHNPNPPFSPVALLPRPPPPSTLAPEPERESVNSFDELLRQQTELDKSIAALRLFSPTTTVMSVPPPPELRLKTTSSPEPPPVDRSSILPESAPLGGRARDPPFPSRARRQSRIPHSAVSTNLDVDDLSTPVQMRFGSQGTQYDVTSFIGDLTTPGPSSSEPRVGLLGEVTEKPDMEFSDIESPVISPATASVTLRPLLLSSASPPITSLPPATASSGALPSTTQPANSNYEYPVLKPLLLGSAAPTGSVPRRPPGPAGMGGPRRPSRAGRDGRPIISVPRPQEEDQVEEAEAFEKPRRPPVLNFQSDNK